MSEKKVALITGASAPMGVPIVRQLLDEACVVYGQVYTNKEALSCINNENLHVIACDLNNTKNAAELVDNIAKDAGRIDILINLIGPYDQTPLLELSEAEWRNQMHLNLDLVFLLTNHAKKYLIDSKGQVLNFAFAGAELIKARIESTAYCIAKAGVLILTKSFAKALAPHGVRVNCLSPGLMATGQPNEERRPLIQSIPAAREGEGHELAKAVKWLLFDSPEYINGANLAISGAWEYI